MTGVTRQLAANGLVFDVEIGGPDSGETVLLLHGFPESSREWRAVADVLHEAGYRTASPNLRGYSPGARPSAVAEYTLEKLIGDVLGLADALGLARFHLAAHDWGGFVAWHVAARHPERLRSLTVVSVPHPAAYAKARRDDPDQRRRGRYMHLFRAPRVPEWLFLRSDAALLRRSFEGAVPAEDVAAHVHLLQQPDAFTGALNWYRAMDLPSWLETPAVRVPTTLVWGATDIAIARVPAEATAAHVTADYRFVELPDGHWLPEQRPDEVAAAIVDRLGRAT